MALWQKTGAELLEKRNTFLRDLAHGLDVVYREMVLSGGTWDGVAETLVGATEVPQDTPFLKSALLVPIKDMADSGEGARLQERMQVAGGRKMSGIEVSTSLVLRLHPKVPLNFEAVYLISNPVLGQQPYKLGKIISTVAIGALVCWNEVLLTRA